MRLVLAKACTNALSGSAVGQGHLEATGHFVKSQLSQTFGFVVIKNTMIMRQKGISIKRHPNSSVRAEQWIIVSTFS